MWLLLLSAVALAQEDPPPVVFHRGPLLTNAVALGMGGASVAAAPGAYGALINPAAFASLERPERPRVDGLLAMQALPAKDLLFPRRSPPDGEPVLLLNPTGTLAVGSFGFGASLLGHGYRDPSTGDTVDSWLLGVGGALTDGALSAGAALLLHQSTWSAAERDERTRSAGLELGLRWRPEGSRFAVGAAARTPIQSKSSGDPSLHVLVPAELSFGLALDRAFMERPLQLASDLIITAPTRAAVPAISWLGDPSTPPLNALPVTGSVRLGATWEAVEDQIRLRGGGYWEPGWAGPGRPHATAGVDWHPPLPWSGPPWTEPDVLARVRLTVGLDLAEGYSRTAFSLGLY